MFVPDNCRETFLDGVTDVYFHDVEHSSIPVPPFVAQIMQINNCNFSEPALHIAMSHAEDLVVRLAALGIIEFRHMGNGIFSLVRP